MKLLILSGKFSDCLEIFHTVRKLSRQSGSFPQCMETIHTAENFPDCRETFQTVWYILKLIISYVDVIVQALFYSMVNFARRRKNLPVGNADTSIRFLGLWHFVPFLHILHIVASAATSACNILRMKAWQTEISYSKLESCVTIFYKRKFCLSVCHHFFPSSNVQ